MFNSFKNFASLKLNLTLKIKVKVTSFRTPPRPLYDQYMTWFKFEDKIQNASKVIVFTRNHRDATDADDNNRTKNNMSPPSLGGGERHNNQIYQYLI